MNAQMKEMLTRFSLANATMNAGANPNWDESKHPRGAGGRFGKGSGGGGKSNRKTVGGENGKTGHGGNYDTFDAVVGRIPKSAIKRFPDGSVRVVSKGGTHHVYDSEDDFKDGVMEEVASKNTEIALAKKDFASAKKYHEEYMGLLKKRNAPYSRTESDSIFEAIEKKDVSLAKTGFNYDYIKPSYFDNWAGFGY